MLFQKSDKQKNFQVLEVISGKLNCMVFPKHMPANSSNFYFIICYSLIYYTPAAGFRTVFFKQ